jgi:hypothetical protein
MRELCAGPAPVSVLALRQEPRQVLPCTTELGGYCDPGRVPLPYSRVMEPAAPYGRARSTPRLPGWCRYRDLADATLHQYGLRLSAGRTVLSERATAPSP